MAKKEKRLDTLATTLKLARDAQDKGWPPELINKHIILGAGYKSVEAFEKAVVNRASVKVRKNNPRSQKGVIKGYVREVANGITMGLWGQGESLVSSIINGTPWDYEKDLMNTEREEYQDANPVHSTVGNLGGAMLTGVGLTKAALTKLPALAPKVGAPIANLAKEATLEGGIGAVEGGMTALNEGGDVGKSVAMGVGIGGVVAPTVSRLVSPVIDLAKQGLKRSKETFSFDIGEPKPKEPSLPEKRALDNIEEALTNDSLDSTRLNEKLNEFENLGMGDSVSIGHLGDDSTKQLGKDALVSSGPAKTKVKQQLINDLESDRARVQKFMQDGLGYNKKGSPQTVDVMMEQMSSEARPFYVNAFESKPIVNNDVIDEIMALPPFREAYKEAQETSATAVDRQYMPDLPDLEAGETGIWSIYALDQVKKIINLKRELPPSALNAPNKLMAKNLGDQTEILLSEVDEYVPTYGKARNIWSEGSGEKDAYELGMSAYTPNKSAAQVELEFNKLKTPSEREMFRLGASTEAVTKMDVATADTKSHSKIFSSPNQLAKHRILFADQQEATKFEKRLKLLKGVHKSASDMIPRSDTAPSLKKFVSNVIDLASTSSGVASTAVKAGNLVADPLRMVQQKQTNKAVGDLLSPRGGKKTGEVLKKLDNRKKELSENILNRGLLTGAITGAGAHMMGGSKKQGSNGSGLLSY
ncbi:MAG: hypothetical protein HOE64_17175 [Nitrospina sp.]|nr:hypothetical protein [Nitrospina sp.]